MRHPITGYPSDWCWGCIRTTDEEMNNRRLNNTASLRCGSLPAPPNACPAGPLGVGETSEFSVIRGSFASLSASLEDEAVVSHVRAARPTPESLGQ